MSSIDIVTPTLSKKRGRIARASHCAACALFVALACPLGCSRYLEVEDMYDQPAYKTYEPSSFFGDRQSARPTVPGTIAQGQLHLDDAFYRGRTDEGFVAELPMAVDTARLARGRERYDIYCSPCHGTSGYGNGMVTQRGFRRPASFHIDRLREAPPGYLFDTMTRGIGAMAGYTTQISPDDRWAIVAYLRALQLSQNATPDDVPPEQIDALQGGPR